MIKIECFASSSSGNCYLLQSEKCNLLLDCGISKSDLISKLAHNQLTLSDIDLCLISHEHKDHSLLANELSKYTKVLSCYESEYIQKIEPNAFLRINDIRICPFEVNHGKTRNFGYIIRDKDDYILFATDCSLIEYKFTYPMTKIMIECNYLTDLLISNEKCIRQMNTHMSLENLKVHLSRWNLEHLEEIYLMHLSDQYSDERIMQAQIQSFAKAKTYICLKKGGVK